MRRAKLIGVTGGVLLALYAGWWLLRTEPGVPTGAGAALQRPAHGATTDESGFTGTLPSPATTPTPLAPTAPGVPTALAGHDGETALDAAHAPAALDVVITHADGAPATGASLALGRDGKLLASGVTDRAGHARLVPPADDPGGAAELAIGGVTDAVLRRPIEATTGTQVIVLPAGAVVAGIVLVDGAPPRMPLRLTLTSPYGERGSITYDDLFRALAASPPGSGAPYLANAQRVGTDGRFEFSGLAAGAWRFLGGDGTYAWETDPAAAVADGFVSTGTDAKGQPPPHRADWPLEAGRVLLTPAPSLVVRLHASPIFTGRVVEARGGAPVPFAGIQHHQHMAGGNSGIGTFVADADGRFVLPLNTWRVPAESVELQFTHPAGTGYRVLTLGAEDCAHGKDLGDVALDPARLVSLLVQDEAGAPIVGAIAVSDDARAARSPPTDAAGHSEFHVSLADTLSITVWAHCYFLRTVPLPRHDGVLPVTTRTTTRTTTSLATATSAATTEAATTEAATTPTPDAIAVTATLDEAVRDDLVVVMQRAPSIEVSVERPDGTTPTNLDLTLRSAQTLFASAGRTPGAAGFPPNPMVTSLGMSRMRRGKSQPAPDGSGEGASGELTFRLADVSPVLITDVLPGVPFDLLVHDKYGSVVHAPESVVLSPGEARTLRIVVTTEACDLAISVRDAAGRPLRASVALHAEVVFNRSWVTGDDGLLSLPGLEGVADASLLVRSTGYADLTVQPLVPPPGGGPLIVVLQPGRRVAVHVRDVHGNDVPAEGIGAKDRDQRDVGRWVLVGTGRAPDLPLAEHESRSVDQGDDEQPLATDRSRWLLVELPPDDVFVEATVGGSRFRQACAAASTELEIIVPATGAVRVRWDTTLRATTSSWLELRRAEAGADVVLRHDARVAAGACESLVPALLPGEWDIRLFSSEPGTGKQVLLAGPARVSVSAGATAVAFLAPP